MPRRSRVVIPNIPHHVTQRGSRRGNVFFCDEDRQLYLELLSKYSLKFDVSILSYCLMSNHVHHVLVPKEESDLSKLLSVVHMKYATFVNKRSGWTGHLWQERYFSSPLDQDYLFTAVRYVERNPVAAKLVKHASEFKWSSAPYRCNLTKMDIITMHCPWNRLLEEQSDWYRWLMEEEDCSKVEILKKQTRKDLPAGSSSFVRTLEKLVGRSIQPNRVGRPIGN